jgi:hypothetical protein
MLCPRINHFDPCIIVTTAGAIVAGTGGGVWSRLGATGTGAYDYDTVPEIPPQRLRR